MIVVNKIFMVILIQLLNNLTINIPISVYTLKHTFCIWYSF
ncbi:hypothetical protein CHRYSEO8AT_440018 [Chryseobacterium sp. 8AT]|nr:hypothetical protein CHRYSEO8AT_440018 [Chryseobacterium sp. 8AT]